MAIATGAHGVWQQHAVEPRVDDAVAWLQTDTTAIADELWQLVVHLHVHGFGISSGVAERLHHQISTKAQTCKVFQLVARHRTCGVLRTHRCHAWLAIGTWQYALAFWQTASATDHFLRQSEAFAAAFWHCRQAEQSRCWQTQRFACFGSQTTTDDQRNTATGTHLVKQHIALDGEAGNFFAVFQCLAFVRAQFDNVAHIHLRHIEFDRQCTSVFHGVVKNRGDFVAQTHTTKTLVRHKGNVFASEPQHAVGG